MKKIKRINKYYLMEVAFYALLYFLFGWFILGPNVEKTFLFFVSLLIFGILYGFVCTEIFARINPEVYGRIIAIPGLILVTVLNYNFLLLM